VWAADDFRAVRRFVGSTPEGSVVSKVVFDISASVDRFLAANGITPAQRSVSSSGRTA